MGQDYWDSNTDEYWMKYEGVKYGLLEFHDDLMDHVNRTESVGPISTAGADNLSASYGGPTLSFRSSEQLSNTVKTANGTFSAGRYDFLKMYSEFSCYGRKLEMLEDTCKFSNTQNKETQRHVPTRWLPLLLAV